MPEVRLWISVFVVHCVEQCADAHEEQQVVPEAIVRALVNCDVRVEPRHHEAWED
jgi:hypothetical protein